jgi:hypothetical protein
VASSGALCNCTASLSRMVLATFMACRDAAAYQSRLNNTAVGAWKHLTHNLGSPTALKIQASKCVSMRLHMHTSLVTASSKYTQGIPPPSPRPLPAAYL